MFTLFDCIHVLAVLAGLVVGVVTGGHLLGPPGLLVGAFAGALLGYFAGRVPFAVSVWAVRRQLAAADIDMLRTRVAKEYYLVHFLLAELARRGVHPSQFQDTLLRLLHSDAEDQRRFGWSAVQTWLPELAHELEGFDPAGAAQDRMRVLAGRGSHVTDPRS